jgi:hypothetical protein
MDGSKYIGQRGGFTLQSYEGAWHHLVVTYDGSNASSGFKIYVDGVLDGASTDWESLPYNGMTPASDDVNIARSKNDASSLYEMDGLLDDVRLYSRELSLIDVQNIYNGGHGTESSGGAVSELILVSEVVTAEASPSLARILILEEDMITVTLNTDIKAWASRDGGSTWDQITLTDEGDFETDVRILTGEVTLTSSGTSMCYKITTHNDKQLWIRGAALIWS